MLWKCFSAISDLESWMEETIWLPLDGSLCHSQGKGSGVLFVSQHLVRNLLLVMCLTCHRETIYCKSVLLPDDLEDHMHIVGQSQFPFPVKHLLKASNPNIGWDLFSGMMAMKFDYMVQQQSSVKFDRIKARHSGNMSANRQNSNKRMTSWILEVNLWPMVHFNFRLSNTNDTVRIANFIVYHVMFGVIKFLVKLNEVVPKIVFRGPDLP